MTLVRSKSPRINELQILGLLLGVSVLLLVLHQNWNGTPFGRALMVAGISSHWPHNLTFLLNWTLMCGAMMLPTSAQMLSVAMRYWHDLPNCKWLVATVAAGFLLVWIGTGLLLVIVSELLSSIDASRLTLALSEGSIAAALLACGGTYLLSPLAQACAKACRSPLGFFARQDGHRSDQLTAFRVGIDYGANCLGCCGPLMAVMALYGLHSLGWMLVATLFMALQKAAQFPQALTKLAGILLLSLAVASALGLAPFLQSRGFALGYPTICGDAEGYRMS